LSIFPSTFERTRIKIEDNPVVQLLQEPPVIVDQPEQEPDYNQYTDTFQIAGWHGYLGSGKSTGMFEYSLEVQDINLNELGMDYILYTNLKILNTEIRCRPIVFPELVEHTLNAEPFDDQYIIWSFDEMEQYFDARASAELKSRIFSYFIYQVRKRKHHLFYTSPSAYLADIRLRNETDHSTKCEKRHVDNKKACYSPKCRRPHYYKYVTIDDIQRKKVGTYREYNPTYFQNQFDSYDIIKPIDMLSQKTIERVMSGNY